MEGGILKVDRFVNHQMDPYLMKQIAIEFIRRFADLKVNKILTIEASGIAIATLLGEIYDVPVVFAKKGETANSTDDKYIAQAYSFTHKKQNNVFVSKPYMLPGEKVLIVDDFLADGQAMGALVDIVHQAGAEVVGLAVAVEKGQQNGGKNLRAKGYQVESVAIIDSMDYKTGKIVFRN
jgi:xanthine phosphoribosyltransferase